MKILRTLRLCFLLPLVLLVAACGQQRPLPVAAGPGYGPLAAASPPLYQGKIPPHKSGENRWVSVGRNPFTGTPEEGLELLGYSPKVAKLFLERIKERRGEYIAMPDGTLYVAQVYSVDKNHRVWRNVRQEIGHPLKGMLYTVELDGVTYRLFYPPKDDGGCDNYSRLAEESAGSNGSKAAPASAGGGRVANPPAPAPKSDPDDPLKNLRT